MMGSARQRSPGRVDAEREIFQFRGPGCKKPYTFASQPQALAIAGETDREKWVPAPSEMFTTRRTNNFKIAEIHVFYVIWSAL